MLQFDIRSLESIAARVDGDLDPEDPVWEEADPRPAGAIRVVGRLSAAGADRFYFSGRLEGRVALECRRCLAPIDLKVEDEAHFIFVPEGGIEADDPDVYLFDPMARSLDLRPAVRESWLLAAPQFAVCREDCRGICPTCGTDLNTGSCECRAGHEAEVR
jgi:uncharacterized protein